VGQRFADLVGLEPTALEALMRTGQPLELAALEGWLWHGLSLAMPAPLFKLFGRFGKAFHHDPSTGRTRGWNVRMRRGDGEWTPALFRGRPVTYGHYEVVPHPEGALAEAYPQAFLIDYGKGGNRSWDPLARVRDWVVCVGDDVLLGRMYLSLGGRQVPTPSYFGLARGTPLDAIVDPPSRKKST
jgi:hypothetical protein